MEEERCYSMSKKYSVIMMSYLGDYPNAASQRELKFIRAVNSFLSQTYENKELIIVSDGCVKTVGLYTLLYKEYENIKIISREKQKERYPGILRQVGIENAAGERILYLDSDDYISKDHIQNIHDNFKDEWDYALGYIKLLEHKHRGEDKFRGSLNPLDYDWFAGRFGIGSTNYCTGILYHKRDIVPQWTSSKNEDHVFIEEIKKIHTGEDILVPSYFMCHMNGNIYDV